MSQVVDWGQPLTRMSHEKVADECPPGDAHEAHSTPHDKRRSTNSRHNERLTEEVKDDTDQ